MALLTTRQKQQFIGPVLLVFVLGGFIGGIMQGNPVAVTILVVLLVLGGLGIFIYVDKRRRTTAAKAERRLQDSIALGEAQRRVEEAAQRTAVSREQLRRVRAKTADQVRINFKIPVMSDDTLESLTVRVMEQYAEHGGTLPVAEAKAMAANALAEQGQ